MSAAPPILAARAAAVLDRLAAAGVVVRRLENDTRRVRSGDVFVAASGAAVLPARYVEAAIAGGAAAVVCQAGALDWNPAWQVPRIDCEDLPALAGYLADRVAGRPSERLSVVGVTGTNGKTSCTQWIAAAFGDAGRRCGIVGTLGNGFPGALAESPNTTPDALVLQAALADFAADGATGCAVEVSSIGVDEQRVNGTRFDIAVFTNLTRDHLDYHGTMAGYAAAKARFFAWPDLRAAVVNLDDPFGPELLAATSARIKVGYTRSGGTAAGLDWRLAAEDIDERDGLAFTLVAPQGSARVATPLVGRFNVENLLAVAAVLLLSGLSLEAVARGLGRLAPPAGRMERLGGEGGPLVVVDYAHTPDSLAKALEALAGIAAARGGRLACVFGCGGDRDRGKRPLMGEVATRDADRVIVTSDNPRSEDPAAIIAEVLAGAPGATVIADRAEAIRTAVAGAAAGDVVLLAGKGHEPYQEIGGRRLPFSDIEQARAALTHWRETQR